MADFDTIIKVLGALGYKRLTDLGENGQGTALAGTRDSVNSHN